MNRYQSAPTRLDLPSLREIVSILLGTHGLHFEMYPQVRRGYVFGSFARGEQRPDSDIDVLLDMSTSWDRPSVSDYEIEPFERMIRGRLAEMPSPPTWRGHVIDVYLTGDADRTLRDVVRGPSVEMRR